MDKNYLLEQATGLKIIAIKFFVQRGGAIIVDKWDSGTDGRLERDSFFELPFLVSVRGGGLFR